MDIQTELTKLNSKIDALTKLVRKIKTKQDDPDGEKSKARSINNGFNRNQKVSKELQEFLGLKEGEEISRSAVTKAINSYVKEKGLQHPDNGRILILDDKLRKLLKPDDGVDVTFLNLQRYLSKHYITASKA